MVVLGFLRPGREQADMATALVALLYYAYYPFSCIVVATLALAMLPT